ncbi:MAG TPA: HAD-IC family P-type ATPase, partial [Ramlibacter sp.]
TGTLTLDRMAVRAVRTRAGVPSAQALAWAGALARHSLHPAARAVALAAGDVPQADQAQEHAGRGVEGRVAGAGRLRLGAASFCAASAGEGGEVHLADDKGWIASFTLDETLRPDAAAAVTALRQQGLQLQVLSGDQPAAVQRLAARAGIDQARGGQSPQGKLAHLSELQGQGRRVAMVGDGMNDGPVLAQADVSVAMGQAVPLAQARCDFILQGDSLAALPLLLLQARRTRRVIRQNLAWSAGYNAVCVPLALLGQMPPWLAGLGMAASSLFVVLNAARLARLPEVA